MDFLNKHSTCIFILQVVEEGGSTPNPPRCSRVNYISRIIKFTHLECTQFSVFSIPKVARLLPQPNFKTFQLPPQEVQCLLPVIPCHPVCLHCALLSCSVMSDSATPGTVACLALPSGILQARILEWVAMLSPRGSSQPKDQTQVSRIAGGFFIIYQGSPRMSEWVPIPSPGELPHSGIHLGSSALQVDSLPAAQANTYFLSTSMDFPILYISL